MNTSSKILLLFVLLLCISSCNDDEGTDVIIEPSIKELLTNNDHKIWMYESRKVGIRNIDLSLGLNNFRSDYYEIGILILDDLGICTNGGSWKLSSDSTNIETFIADGECFGSSSVTIIEISDSNLVVEWVQSDGEIVTDSFIPSI